MLYGIVYEVYYIDKLGELQARYIKPTNGYHEEDSTGEITQFIHVYRLKEYSESLMMYEMITYIDLYSVDKIETYRLYNGTYTLMEEKPHYFGEIPVGIANIS